MIMQEPAKARIIDAYRDRFGSSPLGLVWSPYRLSPLGAHTDHQGGPALGLTIDHGIALAWGRAPGGCIRIESLDRADEPFDIESSVPAKGFARLAAGIYQAAPLDRAAGGFTAMLAGDLPPGGIASSAAVQVAILFALDAAAARSRDALAAVRLLVAAEQASTGAPVGWLDPAVILYGDERSMVLVDALSEEVQRHRLPRRMLPMAWLLIDSGVARTLGTSPYAERVAECRAAAAALGIAGNPPRLAELSPEAFRRRRGSLPPLWARRAEHVFSECKRVKQALKVLADADLIGLGRLVNGSGDSLMTFFDCGTKETVAIVRALRAVPGVLGASFAGAGFGGHVQALCAAEDALAIAQALPAELPPEALVRVVRPGPGPQAERLS